MRISDWSSDVCSSDLPSPPFIPRLVLKADFDPLVDRYASLLLSEMLQKQRLRALEAEIDRVECVNGGEQSCIASRIARDEVADIDAAIRYSAGDRRADLGEFTIVKIGKASCWERVVQYVLIQVVA